MLIGCRCALVLTISLLGQSAVQAQTAAPAGQTEEAWHHRGSGITVPATIDGMRRGEQRDLSRGGEFDVTTQFGTSDEPVTVYIYRSAYPNVALWFERTRRAMNENLRSQEIDAAPRSFALAGGAPNGLREEFELPAGGRFRSTAVAMAQTGEWIVKVRITSRSLDRAAIAARMDALLAAMRLPDGRPEPHPLLLPPPCPPAFHSTFARGAAFAKRSSPPLPWPERPSLPRRGVPADLLRSLPNGAEPPALSTPSARPTAIVTGRPGSFCWGIPGLP